jgi:hypothetical protein
MTLVLFRRHDNGRLERGILLRSLRAAHLVRIEDADGTAHVVSTPHVCKLQPPPVAFDSNDAHDAADARIPPTTSSPSTDVRPDPTHYEATVLVTPVIYTGPGSAGDYQTIMLDQKRMEHTLLIYNGNVEQDFGGWNNNAGAGNACARVLKTSLQAHGIPTGALRSGGFTSLDQEVMLTSFPYNRLTVRHIIDMSVHWLHWVVRQRTKRASKLSIIYSADARDGYTLGTGIFHVSQDVRSYITESIRGLTNA